MRHRGLATLLVFTGGLLLAGCGPDTGTVSGTITVNNQPLQKGVIVFADAKGNSVTADVADGNYEARVLAGKMRVQISETLPGEKKKESTSPTAKWLETTKEGLPPRYNSQTELTYDVVPGRNAKNWTLDRKAK